MQKNLKDARGKLIWKCAGCHFHQFSSIPDQTDLAPRPARQASPRPSPLPTVAQTQVHCFPG